MQDTAAHLESTVCRLLKSLQSGAQGVYKADQYEIYFSEACPMHHLNTFTRYAGIVGLSLICALAWSNLHRGPSSSDAAAIAGPSASPAPTCNIVLSSAVPHDASIPQSHIGNPTAIQFDFDTLSWNTFIALNWPADPNNNGKPDPDPNKKIGLEDYSPVVWETYKQSYEVFKADTNGNPVKPDPWNAKPQPPPGCNSNAEFARKL